MRTATRMTPDEKFNPDQKPVIVENDANDDLWSAPEDLPAPPEDDEEIEEVEGPQPGAGEESGHS